MTWLDDACIEHVQLLPNLTELWIDAKGTSLTEAGLLRLGELKQLKKLTIEADRGDGFSAETIDALRKSLPACQIDYETNSPPTPSPMPAGPPLP